MRKRVILTIGGSLAALAMGVSAVSGSYTLRGGNHACDAATGTFDSSHVWETGDVIVFGLAVEPAPAPGAGASDVLRAENTSAVGKGPQPLQCGDDVGGWRLITSKLGPGDDSVRLDGKGFGDLASSQPFGPVRKSIDALLSGGQGDDTIRGHEGFDEIHGGGGADTIKSNDGRRDIVRCGGGDDEANVDPKDDVSGCEQET